MMRKTSGIGFKSDYKIVTFSMSKATILCVIADGSPPCYLCQTKTEIHIDFGESYVILNNLIEMLGYC